MTFKSSTAPYPILKRLAQLSLFCFLISAPLAKAQDAATLRAHYQTLQTQLANSQFRRPLHMASIEDAGMLKGDIYGLIEHPFAVVGPALQGVGRWCDILILHLNVKACRRSQTRDGDSVLLNLGRKFDQPLADTHEFEFLYRVLQTSPDYLAIELSAAEGPIGTSDYRILLEAVALDTQSSFIHFSYAYESSMLARVSMRSYLATLGRNKVGFSIVGQDEQGQPVYVEGMRGVIERNTMRYFLAIEAYLGALSAPEKQQAGKRLNDWFAGVESYPLQLHELERDEYMRMKHKELERQLALGTASDN